MKKKFKVSDFAEIVGCTPKTVYKMIEREELITVSEKVNNRETTVIVATDEQINELQMQFGKLPVNNGNCNETVTVNEGNEPVKNNSNNSSDAEIIEKVLNLSREYSERLTSVNEELVTAKSQMLFLTDKLKSDEDSKDYWQKEYFKKDYEVKQSEKSKFNVIIWLISVIFLLFLLLITVSILLGIEKSKTNNHDVLTGNSQVSEQVITGDKIPPAVQTSQNPKKTVPNKKKK